MLIKILKCSKLKLFISRKEGKMPKSTHGQKVIPVEAEIYPEEEEHMQDPHYTINPPGYWYFRVFRRRNTLWAPFIILISTFFIFLMIILSLIKIHNLLRNTGGRSTLIAQEWYLVKNWVSEADLQYEINGKIESCDARNLTPTQKNILYSSSCILVKPQGKKCVDIKSCSQIETKN